MTTRERRNLHRKTDQLVVEGTHLKCTCGFDYQSDERFIEGVAQAHLREMTLIPRS